MNKTSRSKQEKNRFHESFLKKWCFCHAGIDILDTHEKDVQTKKQQQHNRSLPPQTA